jgi:predicted nucleotidyltransferase
MLLVPRSAASSEIKGDDVLDLTQIDLADLCEALDDHSLDHSWWLDPGTGEVVLWSDSFEEQGEQDPETRGLRPIEPVPSGEGYADMEDFIERVRDPRARDLLARAIAGRGAFRRFKDTLLGFPELREAWFHFHDVRAERRAIEWLADERLIANGVAQQAIARRPDPEPLKIFDAEEVARGVADDLRRLYGNRLRHVLLFGSWARGDAHEESDIDLLVVLDRVHSRWEERRRMDEILWRHSFENDTVVTTILIGENEFRHPEVPAVIRAKLEGRLLA